MLLILENLGLSAKRIEIIVKYLLKNWGFLKLKKVLLVFCENIFENLLKIFAQRKSFSHYKLQNEPLSRVCIPKDNPNLVLLNLSPGRC